jgi:ketosteroid isomerase-like protein
LVAFYFDEALVQYHSALSELVKGNAESLKKLFSHRDDVTVSGGFGGYFRGWEQVEVEKNTEMAASRFADGVVTGIENVTKYATPDLGYTVDVERFSAKLAGRADVVPAALRVMSIFRREEGGWKLIHRHGDPISSIQAAESILQK